MSGYIEAGYIAAVGTIGLYATTLLSRERRARRRVGIRSTWVRDGPAGQDIVADGHDEAAPENGRGETVRH